MENVLLGKAKLNSVISTSRKGLVSNYRPENTLNINNNDDDEFRYKQNASGKGRLTRLMDHERNSS